MRDGQDEDGNDIYRFGVNHSKTGRTYWGRLLEKIEGFKIIEFEKKSKPHPTIPGSKVDISELTLQSDEGKRITLVIRKKEEQFEHEAVLLYKPLNKRYEVADNEEFKIKDETYRVVRIDSNRNTVQIRSLALQKEVVIEPERRREPESEDMPIPSFL